MRAGRSVSLCGLEGAHVFPLTHERLQRLMDDPQAVLSAAELMLLCIHFTVMNCLWNHKPTLVPGLKPVLQIFTKKKKNLKHTQQAFLSFRAPVDPLDFNSRVIVLIGNNSFNDSTTSFNI